MINDLGKSDNKRYPRTIMATACIPWDENFEFDKPLFRKQIKHLIKNKITSIYLFGTAGEGYAVNDAQFKDIVTVFADEMNSPGLMPMIGIISISLSQIIERIEFCCGLGIKDFQISFPSWGELSDKEVENFFDAILKRFPECRFMHYNNGLRSRKILGFSDYEKLWRRYPNLVAVKYPGINADTDFSGLTPENPIRFFPLETGYEIMSDFNACGLLISCLNLCYEAAWEYFEAGVNGDRKTIENTASDIQKAHEVFLNIRPKGMMDGAYDKLYTKVNMPEFPLTLYPPYESIDDSIFQVYRRDLLKALPGWFDI